MREKLTEAQRIARYAYRYWMRAGMTEWPTLRRTARALRIRQSAIDECSGDGMYGVTMFNCEKLTSEDIFVEAETPEVEVAWCGYWLPYSGGCYCGQHADAGRRALAQGER